MKAKKVIEHHMTIEGLENDDMVKYWFKNLKPKATTRESCIFAIQAFTDYMKMSPQQIIDLVEGEANLKPRDQKIKQKIDDYIDELKNKGNAPLTVEKKLSGIRSFFKYNDIVLPVLQRRTTARTLEEHKGMPEKDDIRKVLEIADPLEKAIMLVGCSSGLAVNEITNLKVKDFNKGYNDKDEVTVLQLRREKTNFDFVTCLTPEASQAVKLYLDYRGRAKKSTRDGTRRDKQLEKQRVNSENDYLFINRHVPDEYLKTHDEELRKLREETVQQIYRVLCDDCDLSKPKGIWNLLRAHKMRTWFNNRLREAKCNYEIKEFMMGHEIEGSRASYFVGNPIEVKKEYMMCISFLTIQKALDVSETSEYKQIKEEKNKLLVEHDKLRTETERHKVERSELIKIQQENEQLKVKIQDMIEAHWESEADHKLDEEVAEHFHEEEKEQMRKERDQLYKTVNALSETLGIQIDIDKPLTAAEKRAAKNAPDW